MKKRLIAYALFTAFMACAYFPRPASLGKMTGKVLYSQGREELVIRDFFNDRRGGTFVDVGCSDYKEYSTTYYLEKNLGWKGLGIDALDEYAPDYAKYRPNTRFCNYILTDRTGGTTPIFVNFNQKSLSSIMYQPPHYTHTEPVPVPNITLTDLLKTCRIKRFDFLSVDVEGSEPLVLAGFDIRRFRPALVCIEANKSVELQKQLMDYFTKNGYVKIEEYSALDQGQNWYFTPKTLTFKGIVDSLKKSLGAVWSIKSRTPEAPRQP